MIYESYHIIMSMSAELLPASLFTIHSYNPPSSAVTSVKFNILSVLTIISLSSFTQWNMLLGPPEAVQVNVRLSPFFTVAGLAVTFPLKSAAMVTS